MSRLAEALESGQFVVTTELNPPKGTDLARLLAKAGSLKGVVDAFNLTDSHTSRMTMAPVAVAHRLVDLGVEPILQITCRDRNRIALQGDLLAAAALGVSNLLCMTGDDPRTGDHPDAKPVFDLGAIELLRAVTSLASGEDLGGATLKGAPTFYAGGVVNPGAADLDTELRRMEEKIEAGAHFFQTQAVYDPAVFASFMDAARELRVPVIAGYIMLKSGNMARGLNANLPGVSVPEGIIQELDGAERVADKSVEIAGRVLEAIAPMCQGVHIISVGWEARIPRVLEAAGISREAAVGQHDWSAV